MSEETPDQTVSTEAHDRVKGERDAAQTRIAELETAVLTQGRKEIARSHFVDKKVTDPDWAATIAVPNLPVDIDSKDDIKKFLDEQFANLYPVEGEPAPAEPETVAAPDAVEPPGFARPSPAGDGAPPEQKTYTYDDPEIKALVEAGEKTKLEGMHKEGTLVWTHTGSPREGGS